MLSERQQYWGWWEQTGQGQGWRGVMIAMFRPPRRRNRDKDMVDRGCKSQDKGKY